MTRRLAAVLLLGVAIGAAGCSLAPGGRPAPGGPGDTGGGEPEVRVAVQLEASTITVGGGMLDVDLSALPQPQTVQRAARVEVTPAAGGLKVVLDDRRALEAGNVVRIESATNRVTIGGKEYRGGAEVRLNARGKLTVVNRVGLEDYLPGVLPNEIGCERPEVMEAMKAQAVAARTYALVTRGRYAAEGYDLMNTVADQVYTGVAGEKPLGNEAVRVTAGRVATWKGEPIPMNYGSTCGGHTAARDEAWDKPPLPYLIDQDDRGGDGHWCSGSKYFNWQETWTADEFMAALRDNAEREMGGPLPVGARLEKVTVVERGPSGRVIHLEIETDKGTFAARKDRIRWAVRRTNGEPLRSTLFDVTLKKAQGRIVQVVFDGHGWGHGVGLCQVGAMERARRGQNCQTILKHYYRGIHLTRLYDSGQQAARP